MLNQIEEMSLINSKVQSALNKVVDICLIKLEEIIQTNVYDGYNGGWAQAGMRTGQFKKSWQKTVAKIVGNLIEAEIYEDINIMVTDSENFIHTDLNGEDDREDIAEVIESGNGYNFGEREGIPAHYWQDFMIWVNSNATNLFKTALIEQGLQTTGNVEITETDD